MAVGYNSHLEAILIAHSISTLVAALSDLQAVLRGAQPADKSEIYPSLGCGSSTSRKTGQSAPRHASARTPIGNLRISKGGLHPKTNAC